MQMLRVLILAIGIYSASPALAGNVDYFDVGNSGSAVTINWNNGATQKVTLTASTTLTFSNGYVGTPCTLYLVQDATGLRLVTWPASVKWVTVPTLSTLGNKRDIIGLMYDGTNWWAWSIGIGF